LSLELESAKPYRIRALMVEKAGGGHGGGTAVPKPPVNGRMSAEELSRAIDGYAGKLSADDVFSGNVLVAKDGAVVFQKAYGFADRANKVANTLATRFNLGSINKKFTEIAIRQLAAEGKLSLSDTVGKLLPDYAQPVTRSATVEQLLNFQAGVADFFGEEFSRSSKGRFRSNADYYKLVSSLPPLFAPGERTQYCNGCYIVLGAIIERVSGIPYEQYVEENIFRPAGMNASGALQTDAIVPDVAMGYTRREEGGALRSNILMRGAAGSAAGGGYSTVGDLLKFLNALKAGKIAHASAPEGGMAIAGGAPGTSAVIDQKGPWTVIVLSNFDPQTGERMGVALANALAAKE
jgi:CubicO group peptidase (beta-lactamase class C family)